MRYRGHIHSSINDGFPFKCLNSTSFLFVWNMVFAKEIIGCKSLENLNFLWQMHTNDLLTKKNFIWKSISRRQIATKKSDRTMRHRQCNFLFFYRVDWIRTSDLCVPNAALCQTELRPANPYPQIYEPVKDKNKPNPTTKFICLLTSENHPRI